MNGPLIDPMTGALAAVEHAAARPQARTKEAFVAALAMLSPELQAKFFSRVNKEAKKCGLPTCEQMTLHRGGYCCKDHKREHKLRLRVRDRKGLTLLAWTCSNDVQTEGGSSRKCGHKFCTIEEIVDVLYTEIYTVCPECMGELFKGDFIELE